MLRWRVFLFISSVYPGPKPEERPELFFPVCSLGKVVQVLVHKNRSLQAPESNSQFEKEHLKSGGMAHAGSHQ